MICAVRMIFVAAAAAVLFGTTVRLKPDTTDDAIDRPSKDAGAATPTRSSAVGARSISRTRRSSLAPER
jgi:hypothetical protein